MSLLRPSLIKVAKILSKADGGCTVCVKSLSKDWIKEFGESPEAMAKALIKADPGGCLADDGLKKLIEDLKGD